jgi:hypothetical protein
MKQAANPPMVISVAPGKGDDNHIIMTMTRR